MSEDTQNLDMLVRRVRETPIRARRRLVALAGPPASGKSTVAAQLTEALNSNGIPTQLVPMDGFHLDNRILQDRGQMAVKGAPQTFDAAGFLALVRRLRDEADVYYPEFDRVRDLSVAGAGHVNDTCQTVVIEGNYLLFDAPVWRDLAQYWDLSIALSVDIGILRERLIERWLSHGLTLAEATQRAEGNDLANAALIAKSGLPADLRLPNF